MKFFLIGMPGAGKSFWVSQFATELNCPYVDTDTFIEEKYQIKIADIIKQDEMLFRDYERQVLEELIAREEEMLIATGGGTPCFYDNMDLMKNNGLVVYLKRDATTLFEQLMQSDYQRPLLDYQNPEILQESIAATLAKREAVYLKADLIFEPETTNFKTIIKEIKKKNNGNV